LEAKPPQVLAAQAVIQSAAQVHQVVHQEVAEVLTVAQVLPAETAAV
jgi:hypothetical protein